MTDAKDKTEKKEKLMCGIIMPISEIDGCNESHWSEVLDILEESIDDADFESNIVSKADEVGIIHKTIIQNLYDNPIVVADVSGKNPNVMFELGIRLAFDKPTIIVKDDKTSYSFDTSAIEHLEYPRDLRFSKINEFKAKLTEKIKKTYDKASKDTSYTTFLKHFGEFKVAKLDKKEVSGQEFILDQLRSLNESVRRLEKNSLTQKRRIIPEPVGGARVALDITLTSVTKLNEYASEISGLGGVSSLKISDHEDHFHIGIIPKDGANIDEIKRKVESIIPSSDMLREVRRRIWGTRLYKSHENNERKIE